MGAGVVVATVVATAVASGWAGTRWTRHTNQADQRKVTASKSRTVSTDVVASRAAASAGPTKNVRLSRVLLVPLTAVSSSGRLTSDGSRLRWAGRNGVPSTATAPARTKMATVGALLRMAAMTSSRTQRATSTTTMMVLRDMRSTSVAPSGVTTAMRM